MSKQQYETGSAPNVTVVECAGDVVIKGWDQPGILIKGQHRADQVGDDLTIHSSGSLSISLPLQSHISLQSVAGDAIIKAVEGDVSIGQVMGDLGLKNLASLKIGTVHGDVSARNINGSLSVESVMGDLAARHTEALHVAAVHGDLSAHYIGGAAAVDEALGDVNLQTVNGDVTLREVHRDVNLANLGGLLNVQQVHGDIRLKGGLVSGKHHCSADGDIVLRWPADAPLNLLATSNTLKDNLGLQDLEQQNGGYQGRIGDGETTLILEAQGRVIIKGIEEADWSGKFGPEFAGFGADFADIGVELSDLGAQISSRVNAHMQELSARMEQKFGHDFAQSMAEKAARQTERAVQRAMREAERMRVRSAAWAPPRPPAPPAPRQKKGSPVSQEEQKKILGMLAKGIISVEEAETLLKALEE